MNESNNGQLVSGGGGRKRRGAYTGERLSVCKEQAIINSLANGEPIERIARRLHCSKHTAMGVRERESHDIARRKQLIAASAARLAANGFDRLNEEMDAGKIKGALLVPVTGMAVDKVIALSQTLQPQLNEHLHVHVNAKDLYERFNQMTDALRSPSLCSPDVPLPKALKHSKEDTNKK